MGHSWPLASGAVVTQCWAGSQGIQPPQWGKPATLSLRLVSPDRSCKSTVLLVNVCVTLSPVLPTVASQPRKHCTATIRPSTPYSCADRLSYKANEGQDYTIPMLNVPLLLSYFICFGWKRGLKTGLCCISLALLQLPL